MQSLLFYLKNLLVDRNSARALVILLLLPLAALGQYYPSPQPENPANEQVLLTQLGSVYGKNKINILLRLTNLYLNKPLRRDADLKRALSFGTAARDSSIKYHDKKSTDEALLFIADIYTYQNNMQAAENILPALKDIAKAALYLNLSYKYGIMDASDQKAAWEKGLYFAGEARRLSTQFHLPLYEILALKDKAYIDMVQSKGDPENEFLEALKRYRALKYPSLQYTFNVLAGYYFYTGHPDKAEYYSQEAIKTMKATRDTLIAGDIYFIYGMVSFNNGNYQKGLDLGKLAIDYLKIHAGMFCLNQRLVFILPVRALRKMKRYSEAVNYVRRMQAEYPATNISDKIEDDMLLGNIYRDMKAYNKAEEAFLTALKINKTQADPYVSLYKDIGQLYVESKQYEKAKPFLNFVVNHKNNVLASSVKSHLNYLLFLADSATGDYFSAIKHLSFYHNAQEFDLRKAKEDNAKKLAVQFETRQKEDSIKLLSQRAALDKSNLQRANLMKNVTIGGIVLVLIIAGLLYRQSRLRKKNNQTVTLQNKLITHKNEQLEDLVTEKEWLLKEVHHRVKNNLQIVMSLLYTQSAYLQNTDAIDAIRDSQNRVQAISIIHQKLYSKSNVATVVMSDYVDDLVRHLYACYDCSRLKIRFKEAIDPINLDISQAVPLGLILNEAITNSIKYAFDKDGGEIMIEGHLIDSETISLIIADNGKGLPADFDLAATSSLGMEMMRALSKQLGGSFEIKNDPGVVITIKFKIENTFKPVAEKLAAL
ncbi:histidine kinase dimerization/phosphoacceptor domain -containing protein [Mucilaginibacter sp. BT774]|uniref:tetratricopeptide repeat-containing sensor histidine kinase n=1 Tax=Mucilaginibacter sp. BT774 TaxID=3062276 RepID=UPI002674DB6E|nr:histidine kinase dimerization/phosphoacceptor domain -containing protein [Mucilaginibacter sp. BT774]MDO3626219.1 histidine kinase dimerization/phosphoacceptor domain -containing protein [Mucilaginibacter sp. BT774]